MNKTYQQRYAEIVGKRASTYERTIALQSSLNALYQEAVEVRDRFADQPELANAVKDGIYHAQRTARFESMTAKAALESVKAMGTKYSQLMTVVGEEDGTTAEGKASLQMRIRVINAENARQKIAKYMNPDDTEIFDNYELTGDGLTDSLLRGSDLPATILRCALSGDPVYENCERIYNQACNATPSPEKDFKIENDAKFDIITLFSGLTRQIEQRSMNEQTYQALNPYPELEYE